MGCPSDLMMMMTPDDLILGVNFAEENTCFYQKGFWLFWVIYLKKVGYFYMVRIIILHRT